VALATIGPRRVDGVDVVLRRPRLSDGPSWRRARLLDEDRLRPSLSHGDDTWDRQSSLPAWVERVGGQRAAARAGTQVALVLATTSDEVLGEFTFALDERSGLAELSLWTRRSVPREATAWSTAASVLHVLEHPYAVPWVVAPVAVPNPGPTDVLTRAGFEPSATARRLRPYDGVPTDHVVWRLENTATSRARLRDQLG
jgi:RimJ/RimL family protein N-acetyltransferase